MTNEEAITELSVLWEKMKRAKESGVLAYKTIMYYDGQYVEALDLAIKALEQQPCEDCFTDDEKRMFLTSLAREMKICEQVDIEYPNAKIKLAPIIHSIKEKVLRSSLWEEEEC